MHRHLHLIFFSALTKTIALRWLFSTQKNKGGSPYDQQRNLLQGYAPAGQTD